MHGFNVLDPKTPLHRHVFLEASAGTGKTFAIEHLVARFLLETDGPELSEILIVTFTKAAAAELRHRIRENLVRLLNILFSPTAPSYVIAKQAEGEKALRIAEKKIKRALANFEEASIFTIHGFCFHSLQEQALEGNLSFEQSEESASMQVLEKLLMDFLRSQIKDEVISARQLDYLLRAYRYDVAKIAARLAELTAWRLPIEGGKDAQVFSLLYKTEIARLKKKYALSKEELLNDLTLLTGYFEGLNDRKKNLKEEVKIALKLFVDHFFGDPADIDSFLLNFLPEKRLKRAFAGILHYPGFLEELQTTLLPIVKDYVDPLCIEARIAEAARKWLEKAIADKELVFFEDLIQKMTKKIEDPHFADLIRKRYKVALIDEFQDTDPAQWKIFSSLFFSSNFSGYLYVVGDPKQSIYRFRMADLYTYLKAKEAFDKHALETLDTNFRSCPSLVQSLNFLFAQIEDCFPLPRLNRSLSCPPVKAGLKHEWEGKDGKKNLHFCLGEKEEAFYPFVVQEILHAYTQGIPFSECAILVKDRFQAERVQAYLQTCKVSSVTRRSHFLRETLAFSVFHDLLKAVLSPHDLNAVKLTLGGPLFLYDLASLSSISPAVFKQFYQLNAILKEKGVLSFFITLMEDQGLRNALLQREGGCALYLTMEQLAELLSIERLSSEELLPFFEKMSQQENESDAFKVRQQSPEDSVQILTIHVSKGLEFDVVFPLGLILATAHKRGIFRDDEGKCLTLSEEKLRLHADESDAEKMRQFYVALTRARKRLYLPLLTNEKKNVTASPAQLFLNKALKGQTIEQFAQSVGASYTLMDSFLMQETFFNPSTSVQLKPPPVLSFSFSPCHISSYSSLANVLHEQKKKEFIGMPSGAEVGHLLHRLFEELPFEKVFYYASPSDYLFFVKPFLAKTLLEGWEEEVCRLLFTAFHAPLSDDKGDFPLSAIDPKKMIKEMEFLYPTSNGYLKGFVDLFFEHREKYYFIDWKSNHLAQYTPQELQITMQEQDYFLQASIYTSALKKYISLFNPEGQWGGGYYVFLRGLPEGIFKVKN